MVQEMTKSLNQSNIYAIYGQIFVVINHFFISCVLFLGENGYNIPVKITDKCVILRKNHDY